MASDGPDHLALHLRIAQALRQRIDTGDLAEGDRLPSETKLAKEWGTSRPTVRLALDVLEAAQLIDRVPTVGTFVRRPPAVEVRWSTRYRRQPVGETSPFARDARREGADPDWTWDTRRTRADERVAARLGLTVGEHVMRTDYLFRADGRPVQSSTSWEPFGLVGGTPIEEPEGGPGPVGVIARMDSIGIHVDRVTEKVRSRPATDDERRALEIPDGMWVMTIERAHHVGDQVAETADIVIPADRYVLAYEIPVDDAPPRDGSDVSSLGSADERNA